ncbi:MAG: shikimate kinase [Elusimicrobia bacterium]|nr:shikimate kinase [Elusimicrobiota bacterium]
MKNVYLTGFMGTGKSTVGPALARKLGRPFADLDALIVKVEKMSVAEIFARKGEETFRQSERSALARAERRGGIVIALGGGTLLDARSRALVERSGTLVRLTCARRELARRLRPLRATRPKLAGGPLDARLRALTQARRGAYGRPDIVVSTTRRSPAQVAALIARRLS